MSISGVGGLQESSGFAASKEAAEVLKREQERQEAIDAKYKELFELQRVAFLLEYIELRAMHQLEKTGVARVSLRNYKFDFFSMKKLPNGQRYGYSDVFMELLESDSAAVKKFNGWVKSNGLNLHVFDEEDGFVEGSWLVVNFK